MLNTAGEKDTPYSPSFNMRVTEDPWDNQSTKSFYTGSTPTPRLLNTPGGKDTPYSPSFSMRVIEDPWDTQSTKSFYTGNTPTPRSPLKKPLPSGSDVFQAVLQEMYDEIEKEKLVKQKSERKLKFGPGGRSISRIPTRVSLQAPKFAITSKRKVITHNEPEARI